MALAFLLLAHKQPVQVVRLIEMLDHSGALFVLHYDSRAPAREHSSLREWAESRRNVLMLSPRPILWGRHSQVATQIEGVERALHASTEWTHALTLSGQDFPLRTGSEIAEEFSEKAGYSFVSYFDPLAERRWTDVEDRLRRIHLDSPALERILATPWIGRRLRQFLGWKNRLAALPWIRRSDPGFFRCFGGANHVSLSRRAAEYLVSDKHSLRIRRWLRWTGSPDETTFQSVLLNSSHADAIINDDRRFLEFPPGAANPRILTMADLPKLRVAREGGKLLARKFDVTVDADVLQVLRREIASV